MVKYLNNSSAEPLFQEFALILVEELALIFPWGGGWPQFIPRVGLNFQLKSWPTLQLKIKANSWNGLR